MCTVKEIFVNKPNLPQGRVSLVAVSGEYPEIIAALQARGIRCITTEPDQRLQAPVAAHADMQMFHMDTNRTFVLKGEQGLKKQLEEEGFIVAETINPPIATYPGDVLCNALRIDDKLLASVGAVDSNIYSIAENSGIRPIHVNQGYTKCSTAVLNENTIITMDAGIGAAGRFMGLEIMIISERHIQLPGYEYGFIGGCCGLIDKNVLAFTGSLGALGFEKPIRNYCEEHGIEIVELTDGPMIDIGGILPLKVYVEE